MLNGQAEQHCSPVNKLGSRLLSGVICTAHYDAQLGYYRVVHVAVAVPQRGLILWQCKAVMGPALPLQGPWMASRAYAAAPGSC
jgi:hypothetical protein